MKTTKIANQNLNGELLKLSSATYKIIIFYIIVNSVFLVSTCFFRYYFFVLGNIYTITRVNLQTVLNPTQLVQSCTDNLIKRESCYVLIKT